MRNLNVGALALVVGVAFAGCDLTEDCNEAGVCLDGGNAGGAGGGGGGAGGAGGGAGGIGGVGGGAGGAGGVGGGAGGAGGGGNTLAAECAGTCEVAAGCAAESELCGNVVDASTQAAYDSACRSACNSRAFDFADADAAGTCEEELQLINGASAAAANACGGAGGGGGGFPVNGPCSLDSADGDGETEGVCISLDVCEGYATEGLCDGSANIQCCTSHPCEVDGSAGVCKATNACAGASAAGACPGSAAVQCCLE